MLSRANLPHSTVSRRHFELSGGPVILFGAAERLEDKRFALEAVTRTAAADGVTLASIDVRVPERPAALPR